MDYKDLIEEITRLVMMELNKFPTGMSHNPGTGAAEVVALIDPEINDMSGIVDVLQKKAGDARYRIVISERQLEPFKQTAGTMKFSLVVDPQRHRFSEVIRGAEQVIIPYLSVTALSKISGLIGDEHVPGVFIKALLEGIPVIACTDNIHGLKFSDCARPKKLLAMVQQNLTTLEDMGVELVQLEKLPEKIGEKKPEDPDAKIGIRNVITNEDVKIAANQNLKTLNFPKGTIVTPLARDTAKNMGIEIKLV
jgi:hypothetical protein